MGEHTSRNKTLDVAGPRRSAEPSFGAVQLREQRPRQMPAVGVEIFAQIRNFLAPQRGIDREQRRERLRREVESAQVEVRGEWQTADGGVAGARAAGTALEHPGEHPQVLAKAGPEVLAVGVATEPVDVVDARWPREPRADLEPVLPVIAEVVSTERLHRHRVA